MSEPPETNPNRLDDVYIGDNDDKMPINRYAIVSGSLAAASGSWLCGSAPVDASATNIQNGG